MVRLPVTFQRVASATSTCVLWKVTVGWSVPPSRSGSMRRPMRRSLVTSTLATGIEAVTADCPGRAESNASDPSTARKPVRKVEMPMYSSENSRLECTGSIVQVWRARSVVVTVSSCGWNAGTSVSPWGAIRVTSARPARALRGGAAFIERGPDAALQRLVVSIEPQGLDGGPGVRRRATGDQLEQPGECPVISRCREREDDGVPDVVPVLTGQALAEGDDGLGPAGLAERHGGGPGHVAVPRR